MVFISIVLYMGVNILPSSEDYWGTHTRVLQVADCMSSKAIPAQKIPPTFQQQ